MTQLKKFSSLIFLWCFVIFSAQCAGNLPEQDYYCRSGREGCKCDKPKPPGYIPNHLERANAKTDPVFSQRIPMNQMASNSDFASRSRSISERPRIVSEKPRNITENAIADSKANSNKWKNTIDQSGKMPAPAVSIPAGTIHAAAATIPAGAMHATAISKPDSSNIPVVKGCKYGPSCDFNTGVIVRVKNPRLAMLGRQYPVEYEVIATSDVQDVVLTAEISENSSYISSLPEAKVSGRELTWNLGEMKKDQRSTGTILLKSEKEGDISTAFNVRSAVGAVCSTMCAQATISCEGTGPAEVVLGERFNYIVTVANTGSYPAEDVVLAFTDNDKVGQPFNFNLGTIEPGKAKKTTIPMTSQKRGTISYAALVTSSNTDPISKDLSTLVTTYSLECEKNGPKNAILGQKAPYRISVSNTGDRDLHDVVITETVHPATKIVAADGATISDRTAVWKIPVLKAGEKTNFKISLTNRTKGTYTNTTTVANREAYNATRDTSTNWRGHAALDMSMNTSDNSIFVGETTKYKILVTNQGQETDSNVTVVAIFPDGLEPVSSSGSSVGTIEGRSVSFAPKTLGPRQSLEQYVTVKASKQGDLRPKVQVSSDSIQPPITQEESLIVN